MEWYKSDSEIRKKLLFGSKNSDKNNKFIFKQPQILPLSTENHSNLHHVFLQLFQRDTINGYYSMLGSEFWIIESKRSSNYM